MSLASPLDRLRDDSTDVTTLRSLALRPVEATAFWTAVALPLAYPALLVGGLDERQLLLLAGAALLHTVALAAGRDYAR